LQLLSHNHTDNWKAILRKSLATPRLTQNHKELTKL
jgi:hypothetical protein